MTEPDKTTHAIVIPWSISNLQTWCGTPVKRLESISPEHFAASSPDAVTCPKCRNAMRQALKNLQEWVPKLPLDKSPRDEKEKHSYFCLYCKKTVLASEADHGAFPVRHRHCGGELAACDIEIVRVLEKKNKNKEYFCPHCNDIVAEIDTNKRMHPPVHKACGTPVISKEE